MIQNIVDLIYDQYYPPTASTRPILERHSRSVASLALDINARLGLGLDPVLVETAAMLHDVGICRCNAPSLGCEGPHPYLRHGVEGADLLRAAGAPEEVARVAERHTGAGLTADDALRLGLPADRSLMPESLLERLVCYADKFYSKSGTMERKPLDRVRASIAKFGSEAASRFEELHREFGT